MHPGEKSGATLLDDASVGSINPKDVDAMVAKGIGMLSIRDRNAIYEEIHGVSSMAIKETPELIRDSLRNFEKELENADHAKKFAYDAIMNQEENAVSKDVITDDAFRLRFLRFVFFDAKAAVARMISFLDILHTLYGMEALKKFDDSMDFFINTKELKIGLRAGYIQLLPFRDRSGRRIIVFVTDCLKLESKVRIKIFLYITYVAGEDVETQKHGCLMLFWPGVEEIRPPESSHRSLVSKIINSLPTRFACFHFCFPNTPFFNLIRALLSMTMAKQNFRRITRVKVHCGERIEMLYELMGYGIPVALIPTTGTGTLKTKTFAQWIKTKKMMESLKSEGSRILECPGMKDVIFRSAGKSCMLHPGNVVFRGIFEKYHDEHVKAGQTGKRDLVWKIVQEIESKGGRFLGWDKRGWWVVLEERSEIRSKVAISLRDYNKQQKAIANEQVCKSFTYVFKQLDSAKRRKQGNMCDCDSSDEGVPHFRESCCFAKMSLLDE